jgi:hypothetical protein
VRKLGHARDGLRVVPVRNDARLWVVDAELYS